MSIIRPNAQTARNISQSALFGDWLWSRMCFVVAGFLIVFAIGWFLYDQQLRKISTRAVGTVVALGKNMDDQTVATVEFAAEGKTYKVQGTPATPAMFTMGQKVNVYFDPSAPQSARLDVWHERYFFVFLGTLMAVVFFLWGRYFNKRYKNPPKEPEPQPAQT